MLLEGIKETYKEKREKKNPIGQSQVHELSEINLNRPVIPINENRVNSAIKRQKWSNPILKIPVVCYLKIHT